MRHCRHRPAHRPPSTLLRRPAFAARARRLRQRSSRTARRDPCLPPALPAHRKGHRVIPARPGLSPPSRRHRATGPLRHTSPITPTLSRRGHRQRTPAVEPMARNMQKARSTPCARRHRPSPPCPRPRRPPSRPPRHPPEHDPARHRSRHRRPQSPTDTPGGPSVTSHHQPPVQPGQPEDLPCCTAQPASRRASAPLRPGRAWAATAPRAWRRHRVRAAARRRHPGPAGLGCDRLACPPVA